MILKKLECYWGIRIKPDFNLLVASTGSAQKRVYLSPGFYSPNALAAMMQYAMRRYTGFLFNVNFDFSIKRIKITAQSPFTLHISSSAFGGGKAYLDLGFGNSDFTGTSFVSPLPIDSLKNGVFFLSNWSGFSENKSFFVGDVAVTASALPSSFFYLGKRDLATATFAPITQDEMTAKMLPSPFDESPTVQKFGELQEALASGQVIDCFMHHGDDTQGPFSVQTFEKIERQYLSPLAEESGLFQSQPMTFCKIESFS